MINFDQLFFIRFHLEGKLVWYEETLQNYINLCMMPV